MHGDSGYFSLPTAYLLAKLHVTDLLQLNSVTALSNISFEESKTHDGETTVTIKKWSKYQEDSTVAERMRALRNKRRGEERRKEEIRREDIPGWIDPELWKAFQEVRRNAKAKMTERAERLIITELDKLKGQGHNPSKVLEQSIRNGWKDVYPLKNKQEGNGAKPGEIDHGKNKDAIGWVAPGAWKEFKPRTPIKEPVAIGKVIDDLKLSK